MLFHYSIGTNVVSTPTWTRTRTKTLGKSRAVHYTIGIKSRRLDSHQHDLVYKTSAFLNRATSAIRVTERNRTAVQQIHSLSPETSTGPGHSGRSGSRTRKTLSTFDRLPTGSRRQSGGPSIVSICRISGPTRIRTRNARLEAGCDFRFTIRPCQSFKRKARDSNPHLQWRAALAVRSGQPYPATFRIN